MNLKKPVRRRLFFISLFLLLLFLLPPSLKTVVGVTGQQELFPISVGSLLTSIKAKIQASMVLNTLETVDSEAYYYFGFSSGGWLGSTKATKITQVVSGKVDSITTISEHRLDPPSERELTVTTQTSEELSEDVVNSPKTKSGEIERCRSFMSRNVLFDELYFEIREGGEEVYCGYREYGVADVIADMGSMRRGGSVLIQDYYPGYFDLEDYLAEEGLPKN